MIKNFLQEKEQVQEHKLKVLNLYGGPGVGKSTIAAGLFYEMKKLGYKVELITEFAKDLVYSEDNTRLSDQLLVFAEQHHKIFRLKNKVDYVITDSPLNLSIVYNTSIDKEIYKEIVNAVFNNYENINFFIERNDDFFQEYGRIHNLEQSKSLDEEIRQILGDYYSIDSKEEPIKKILRLI